MTVSLAQSARREARLRSEPLWSHIARVIGAQGGSAAVWSAERVLRAGCFAEKCESLRRRRHDVLASNLAVVGLLLLFKNCLLLSVFRRARYVLDLRAIPPPSRSHGSELGSPERRSARTGSLITTSHAAILRSSLRSSLLRLAAALALSGRTQKDRGFSPSVGHVVGSCN